jgi:hypothetical protein
MFHPVPRVDRWEPLVGGTVLLLIVTGMVIITWLG